MFRKAATLYSKRFTAAAEFNRQIVKLCSRADFDRIAVSYQTRLRKFPGKN